MQIVLMYHDVYVESYDESGFLKESTNQYKIRVDEFEKHVIAVTEYCRAHKDVDVRFTFDDGGRSFATIIAPILEKHGIKGSFFISAKFVGDETFVTFDQLEDLKKRGHTIGSHSYSHPNLARLTSDEIDGEWRRSIMILAPYLGEEKCASIPEGYSSKDVIGSAAKCGLSALYTSEPETKIVHQNGMKVIGRFVIYEGMTAEDVMDIVTNEKKRWKLKVKRKMIGCVKTVLGNKYDSVKASVYKRIAR